jgi:hypothetical protein
LLNHRNATKPPDMRWDPGAPLQYYSMRGGGCVCGFGGGGGIDGGGGGWVAACRGRGWRCRAGDGRSDGGCGGDGGDSGGGGGVVNYGGKISGGGGGGGGGGFHYRGRGGGGSVGRWVYTCDRWRWWLLRWRRRLRREAVTEVAATQVAAALGEDATTALGCRGEEK